MTEDLIRISVGTEFIGDIIYDFEQSFKASKAVKPDDKGNAENKTVEGSVDGGGKLGGSI